MKVKEKNFGIETPGETVYFKMVSTSLEFVPQSVLGYLVICHSFLFLVPHKPLG